MKRKTKIYYTELDDFWRKQTKLDWLRDNPISNISFESITPDKKHNWINQTDNDFETFIPITDKEVKNGKSEEAVFELYSLGVSTNRDEWVTDFSSETLQNKMKFFIKEYNKAKDPETSQVIKWSRNLKRKFIQRQKESFSSNHILETFYRPFVKKHLYFSDLFIDEKGNASELFLKENKTILYRHGDRIDFFVCATSEIPNLNIFSLDPAQATSIYRYDLDGSRLDNITDWALQQFKIQYENLKITKEDIFHYTYGALHSPAYRKKYEQNLKREFPRIPFYDDFFQWRDWGAELMDLHINYETQEPFPLERIDADLSYRKKNKQDDFFSELDDLENETFTVKARTKLRADKTAGVIEIDSQTVLSGVPPLAWEYKLGNRSAIEWILDQYKERKPKDATIAERFNTYKFEDYKEQTIDLLMRVTNVSVKTMEIINQMPQS